MPEKEAREEFFMDWSYANVGELPPHPAGSGDEKGDMHDEGGQQNA